MCNAPVTFGGGIGIVNGSLLSFCFGLNAPDCSHLLYKGSSTSVCSEILRQIAVLFSRRHPIRCGCQYSSLLVLPRRSAQNTSTTRRFRRRATPTARGIDARRRRQKRRIDSKTRACSSLVAFERVRRFSTTSTTMTTRKKPRLPLDEVPNCSASCKTLFSL